MDKFRRYSAAAYKHNNVCRFCGREDEESVDIFLANKTHSASSSSLDKGGEELLNKISTVYPFVMYENDPLPQHICPKCIENVSLLYREIQEVLRHQKMLMNLIRAEQPQHEYFRILNEIEESAKTTKGLIKASYNVDINQNTPIKLLTFPRSDTKLTANANFTVQKPVNEKLVQNIQTKLELNGFTIKRIKVAQVEDKSEPTPIEVDENVQCPCCDQSFPSQKALAHHQVTHLKVSTDKIFEKRLLPKNMRRGRLICINNEKNIRCLNCWQVFKDNKSILQHWSGSDCYYYCFICGKEFPHSPKTLREHMPTVHGISFRSTMKQFIVSRTTPAIKNASSLLPTLPWKIPPHVMTSVRPTKLIVSVHKKKKYYKQGKSSTKNDDGTFSCNICHKVFTNYRSSNSHMRIHNMPEIYGSEKKDVYSNNDEMLLPDGPPAITLQHRPPMPIAYVTTPSNITHPVRPPYKIITNNGPLRGIRTKIVQKRNDFIANSGHGGLKINTIEAIGTSRSSSWATEDTNQQQYDWTPLNETGPPFGAGDSNQRFNHANGLNDYASPPHTLIKREPMDHINRGPAYSQWTCFICKDHFASSKEYEMHAMFVHNIN